MLLGGFPQIADNVQIHADDWTCAFVVSNMIVTMIVSGVWCSKEPVVSNMIVMMIVMDSDTAFWGFPQIADNVQIHVLI